MFSEHLLCARTSTGIFLCSHCPSQQPETESEIMHHLGMKTCSTGRRHAWPSDKLAAKHRLQPRAHEGHSKAPMQVNHTAAPRAALMSISCPRLGNGSVYLARTESFLPNHPQPLIMHPPKSLPICLELGHLFLDWKDPPF